MKKNDDYLTEHIDKAISELVHPKWKLQKAYNYYNGKRDAEQFRYLEENFGIGNPTSVEFTPLIKKHVDSLIGEYLDIPLLPKISCKDEETLSKIHREKELEATSQVLAYYRKHLTSQIYNAIQGKAVSDVAVKEAIDKLISDIDTNFISSYEKAAQNVLQYVIQSKNTDLLSKLRILILDLLVSGSAFYKVSPSPSKTNVSVITIDPLNVFVDRNPQSQYVNDSYRVVIREWLTKNQILNKYGPKLSAEGKKELEDMYEHYTDSSYMYVRSMENVPSGRPVSDGEGAGLQESKAITPGFPADTYESFNYKFLPVYEVEWLDTDEDFKMSRYEGVRIGQSIYILTGESENITRTQDAPNECKLSVNGLYLTNRDNVPYSLVLACSHLQDKYDIVTYFRDTVLSNSGTDGDWLDVSMLPSFLGHDLTERIMKWQAYKKAGIGIIDTAQDGRAFNNNTSFAGFSDTIKVQTMQAFDIVLQRIEDQCSSITGVFRERLNGIQQRDAVSNVEAGARNSFTITKGLFQQIDKITTDILSDCLDIAKVVWKKGLSGTLILGDKLNKVFTALPEHFTHTDYDIHIVPSTQIMEDMKNVQQTLLEMIKSGQVDMSVLIDAITARSLTELKEKIAEGIKKAEKEHNQMSQFQQQLEQAQQQIKQYEQQLQQAQQKIEQLNEKKLAIEEQKVKNDYLLGTYQARTERDFKSSQADNDDKRTEVEVAQLYDGDQRNNTIRQELS